MALIIILLKLLSHHRENELIHWCLGNVTMISNVWLFENITLNDNLGDRPEKLAHAITVTS